jgi:hypothetical protein
MAKYVLSISGDLFIPTDNKLPALRAWQSILENDLIPNRDRHEAMNTFAMQRVARQYFSCSSLEEAMSAMGYPPDVDGSGNIIGFEEFNDDELLNRPYRVDDDPIHQRFLAYMALDESFFLGFEADFFGALAPFVRKGCTVRFQFGRHMEGTWSQLALKFTGKACRQTGRWNPRW